MARMSMTYAPSAPNRKPMILLFLLVAMSLWPLYALVSRVVPTQHADVRHGNERHPPETIRACLANLVLTGVDPYQYELPGQDRVAVVCRMDKNYFGIQINNVKRLADGSVLLEERTAFYGTMSRVLNILSRDGYVPVVPIPTDP